MVTVTITLEEYRALMRKSLKYDLLRAQALGKSYISQDDKILFDIKKEELRKDDEE